MKFLIDGQIYQGRSYKQVVAKMAVKKPEKVKDLAFYRETTAARVKDLYQKEVNPSSNKSFLEGLVEAGLAQRVYGGKI